MTSAWAPLGALPAPLLFIADAAHAPADSLLELVLQARANGLDFLELRRTLREGVGWGSAARLAEIKDCLAAAPEATFLVNDRVDLALAAGAHGAHVGQDDLGAERARSLLGPGALLGLSTHDEIQFQAAQALPLDYVALGPIFASRTKSGHAEPVGLTTLESCCRQSGLPVVAIGGIGPSNARLVFEAGAACLAVASCLAPPKMGSSAELLLRLAAG